VLDSRHLKSEKAQFTLVNEHFSDEHNAEDDILFMTLFIILLF